MKIVNQRLGESLDISCCLILFYDISCSEHTLFWYTFYGCTQQHDIAIGKDDKGRYRQRFKARYAKRAIKLLSEYSDDKYSEDKVIQMTELLIDNVFVHIGNRLFQQIIWIYIGINYIPRLSDF